jgi:hypothetical protein
VTYLLNHVCCWLWERERGRVRRRRKRRRKRVLPETTGGGATGVAALQLE